MSTSQSLTYKTVDFWLHDLSSAWLNTVHPNGHAHSVPVCFWWNGSEKLLYFITRRDAGKTRHIAAHPAVRLQASYGEISLIAEGDAHRVEDSAELLTVGQAWQGKYPDEHFLNAGEDLYRVQVDRICVWEYRDAARYQEWEFEHLIPSGAVTPTAAL